MYENFMADCKREMYIRKLSNGDLANMTGYKKSTINAFFTDKAGREKSRNVAESISAALQVEL